MRRPLNRASWIKTTNRQFETSNVPPVDYSRLAAMIAGACVWMPGRGNHQSDIGHQEMPNQADSSPFIFVASRKSFCARSERRRCGLDSGRHICRRRWIAEALGPFDLDRNAKLERQGCQED